jgi:UDP-glucuronate decarboxylase
VRLSRGSFLLRPGGRRPGEAQVQARDPDRLGFARSDQRLVLTPRQAAARVERTGTVPLQITVTAMKSSSKRILVTGGAGFLGSHLCERLLALGHEVLCVDNFYTGHKRNVLHLLDNPLFMVIEHDVTEPLFLHVDQIYNLACPASPVHYQFDPIHTVKTSVLGAIHMLGLARRVGARILHASTSEVYGDPQVHPQREEYWGHVNPIGERACYDEGKRCAETLFFDYHRRHQIPVKVARIFNTYGPRMHPEDGRVVSNFVVQALTGEPITVYGDGSQTRSFCFVDDLIEGFIRFMGSPDDLRGPLNLGNPAEFTISELAEEVLSLTGSTSGVAYVPLPADDPRKRQPDISLARDALGWEPVVTLRQGLIQTIEYFDRLLRHPQRPTLPRQSAQSTSVGALVPTEG